MDTSWRNQSEILGASSDFSVFKKSPSVVSEIAATRFPPKLQERFAIPRNFTRLSTPVRSGRKKINFPFGWPSPVSTALERLWLHCLSGNHWYMSSNATIDTTRCCEKKVRVSSPEDARTWEENTVRWARIRPTMWAAAEGNFGWNQPWNTSCLTDLRYESLSGFSLLQRKRKTRQWFASLLQISLSQ